MSVGTVVRTPASPLAAAGAAAAPPTLASRLQCSLSDSPSCRTLHPQERQEELAAHPRPLLLRRIPPTRGLLPGGERTAAFADSPVSLTFVRPPCSRCRSRSDWLLPEHTSPTTVQCRSDSATCRRRLACVPRARRLRVLRRCQACKRWKGACDRNRFRPT